MSPIATVVRRAVPGDAEAIGEVHAEAWRVAYAGLFEEHVLLEAVADRRSRWGRNFGSSSFPSTTLLVAEADDAIIGFAHFGPSAAHTNAAEISGFYLHPASWGNRAASDLMHETLVWLAEQSYETVGLWTHPGASRARGFYAKQGFRETGRSKGAMLVQGPPVLVIEYCRNVT